MKLVVFFAIVLFVCLSKSKYKVHIAILLLAFLCSSRPDTVPDTIGYRDLYLYNINGEFSAEIGFQYLCYFFHNIIGLGFSQFLFLLALLSGEIWYAITKRIIRDANYGLAFLLFISFFGIYYFGVVLRASLAILICYAGISLMLKGSVKDFIAYVVIVGIAFFFHKTSLLFLMSLACLFRYKSFFLYGALIVSIIIAIIHPFTAVQSQLESFLNVTSDTGEFARFAGYVDDEYQSTGIDLIYVSYLIIASAAIFFRDSIQGSAKEIKTFNLFLNMYVLAIVMYGMVMDFRALSRLPMQWLFFEFIIVYFLLFRNNNRFVHNYRYLSFFLICVAKFILLVHRTPLLLNY